ncbi:MAG: DUF1592 domain-containing protein, partial [Sandaracinaceae bacterium]
MSGSSTQRRSLQRRSLQRRSLQGRSLQHRSLLLVAALAFGCTGVVTPPNPGGGSGAVRCDEVTEIDPPATPLLRLTHVEYDNILRDTFGVTDHPAATFAPDEIAGSLVINAINPVGATQVRDYMTAADTIAAAVAPRYAELGGCDASEGEACVSTFVSWAGRRLYRRPLRDDEVAGYLALYRDFAVPGPADGVALVLSAMLQSPHFLYHVELEEPGSSAVPGSVAKLPAYAFAARLAFFVWKSGPDDALLDAARDGRLDDPESVGEVVETMLADPRSRDTLAEFHSQWLGLARLDGASRDATLYPDFDAATITAMREETIDFVDHVYRSDDASFTALMTAPFSFPRGDVLAIEGVTEVSDPSSPTPLDPTQRAGLLTQPSFLTAHSHVSQSSPILRGRAIRERFFCQPLRDPPPNVNATEPDPDPTLTTRERFAAHRDNPACASCHMMIDDLGFALERYDAVGAYRE